MATNANAFAIFIHSCNIHSCTFAFAQTKHSPHSHSHIRWTFVKKLLFQLFWNDLICLKNNKTLRLGFYLLYPELGHAYIIYVHISTKLFSGRQVCRRLFRIKSSVNFQFFPMLKCSGRQEILEKLRTFGIYKMKFVIEILDCGRKFCWFLK